MKKKLLISSGVLVAIVLIAWAFIRSPKPEPIYQGQPFSFWLKEVYSTNQNKAFLAMHQMGPEKFPLLIAALKKKDSLLDTWWQKAYAMLPVGAKTYFSKPVPATVLTSAAGLILLNSDTTTIIPELSELLRIPDSTVRSYALNAMCFHLSKTNAGLVPLLLSTLSDPDMSVRYETIRCLERIGPAAEGAAPKLTALLNDQVDVIRLFAAEALWNIKHDTNRCVKTLEQLLGSTQSVNKWQTAQYVRHWAAVYLNGIQPDPKKTLPVFIASLEGSEQSLQLSAAHAVLMSGDSAAAAIPILQKCAKSTDSQVRAAAIVALKQLDPKHVPEN